VVAVNRQALRIAPHWASRENSLRVSDKLPSGFGAALDSEHHHAAEPPRQDFPGDSVRGIISQTGITGPRSQTYDASDNRRRPGHSGNDVPCGAPGFRSPAEIARHCRAKLQAPRLRSGTSLMRRMNATGPAARVPSRSGCCGSWRPARTTGETSRWSNRTCLNPPRRRRYRCHAHPATW